MATTIDHRGVQKLCERGAQLLDVLPEAEYRESHLPGAMSAPLARLADIAATRLDARRPVITYCYDFACDLSPRAAALLESLGFRDVFDYPPGKMGWQTMGLPVEGDDGTRTIGRLAQDVPTCRPDEVAAALRQPMNGNGVVAVTDDRNVVLGLVSREGMRHAPKTFRPSVSEKEMSEYAREHDLSQVLVTRADGTLIGLLDIAGLRSYAGAGGPRTH